MNDATISPEKTLIAVSRSCPLSNSWRRAVEGHIAQDRVTVVANPGTDRIARRATLLDARQFGECPPLDRLPHVRSGSNRQRDYQRGEYAHDNHDSPPSYRDESPNDSAADQDRSRPGRGDMRHVLILGTAAALSESLVRA